MRSTAVVVLALASLGVLLAVACGEGGDVESGSALTPDVSPVGGPGDTDVPSPEVSPVSPPLEGPARGLPATERTDFWGLPEFALPAPGDLPELAETAQGPELRPPAEPECPEGWQEFTRPAEGFSICYPESWRINGNGFVSAGAEDQWYSVGFFSYEDGVETAHASVYVLNPYARPLLYTRDCEQAYRVELAGEPAVLCPDFPGQWPEVRIVSYHVRKGDLDYFVNAVPRFRYDPQSGYSDTWSEEAEAVAIQIAHSFRFVRLVSR